MTFEELELELVVDTVSAAELELAFVVVFVVDVAAGDVEAVELAVVVGVVGVSWAAFLALVRVAILPTIAESQLTVRRT